MLPLVEPSELPICRALLGARPDCRALLGARQADTTLSFVCDLLDEGIPVSTVAEPESRSLGHVLGAHGSIIVNYAYDGSRRRKQVIEVQELEYSRDLFRDMLQAEVALPSRGGDLVAQKLGNCR